jgi:hypothetical protein
MSESDAFPDAPYTVTVLGDRDGEARWVAKIENYDITAAAIAGGIHLLVMLDQDGLIRVATKPGNAWDSTWSPPIMMERR